MYRSLKSDKIIQTAEQLRTRVQERFPSASLGKVAVELCEIALEAHSRCQAFRKRNTPLRIGIGAVIAVGVTGLIFTFMHVRVSEGIWLAQNFLEAFEAALGSAVFIGASILFLATLEKRVQRGRAIQAINELRAIAHIIDMHQLTKDPEPFLARGSSTPSSPKRTLTPFELGRYFDYCSEMLSVISKIAALYAEGFPDPVVLSAVDDVETLASGLSRKIWQKIMVLDRYSTNSPEVSRNRDVPEIETASD